MTRCDRSTLALLPLAVSLLRKGDDRDLVTRLDETLEAAPPDARATQYRINPPRNGEGDHP